MNANVGRPELVEGAESYRVTEIVVDEDVLSPGARAALEQVGSATGLVLAIALIFALLPRASRILAGLAESDTGRG